MIVPRAARRGKVRIASRRRRSREETRKVVARLVGMYPHVLTTADRIATPAQQA